LGTFSVTARGWWRDDRHRDRLYEATDAIEIVRDWILEHDEELRANEGALPDELAELLAKVEAISRRRLSALLSSSASW
jgi:hypothetical protein